MSGRRSSRLGAAALVAAALLSACQSPADRAGVPRPDLAGVEDSIAEAVAAARAEVARNPDSAAAWGALGDRYYVHGWRDEAAECYRHSAEIEPNWPTWHFRLGYSLFDRVDRREESLAAFERALELNQSHAPAHENCGKLMIWFGRLDEARRYYAEASRLDPTSSHAELGLGQVAIAAGRFEEAREHLEEALRRNPEHTRAHLAISQVYLALGDEERARHHAEITRTLPNRTPRLDTVLPQVEPRGSRMHTNRARELERAGDLRQAELHYREALASNPEYQAPHSGLGSLLARSGRTEEAEQHLREAVRLRSSDAAGHVALAMLLARGNDFDEAAAHFSAALAIDPDRKEIHLPYGTVLARQGKPGEAIEQLTEAVRHQPGLVEPHVSLGAALVQDRRTGPAIESFRKALAIDPRHPAAHCGLADALGLEGRIAEAISEHRRALELRPGWPRAAQHLAWTYATHPDPQFRNADRAVELALGVDRAFEGENPIARDTLAAAQAEAGRFDDAAALARQALALAESYGEEALAVQIRGRLELYRSNRPFREAP